MPLVAWEYLDSGTGDENLLKRNTEDFKKIVLTPRFVKGSFIPDLSTSLFAKTYSAPFGVSPVGLASLMAPSRFFFSTKCYCNTFEMFAP